MKRSTFLSITALLSLVFGVGLLLFPLDVARSYCMTIDEAGVLFARSVGASLLALGLVNWLARNAPASSALNAVLYGNLALHIVTMLLDAFATVTGVICIQGWGTVAMHVVLASGFAYYLFAQPKGESA